ncbi:uncharacterized protein (DUF608 family) [Chitinophaga terrae (ex Kim and Jung 2007)]|uniref:GH116 family glycosyl hydrolase n=1 Tax=Chitinophaga terrae (ex Kim and Jung 2007) TaxID=408074 RepID=UPI00277D8E1C|nr:GH116 family glycosyl hydrolase [Chitinophaga terrae (ex Kim and Jung 2007)]MDQ0109051.1 uncharacterized protein (DUF608 family) [Chitinophaga terrae (ex Kim and Jung 2007)]
MNKRNNRRSFLRNVAVTCLGASAIPALAKEPSKQPKPGTGRRFNDVYKERYNNRIAFPVGGIGAGMFCLEGTGAISHMSVRHNPEIFYEPTLFAALAVKGKPAYARVLEGLVPDWKKFGQRDAGLGGTGGASWGLPRYRSAEFRARFPFAEVNLRDADIPIAVKITGWSPFTPGAEDNASMPVGALEYEITNKGAQTEEFIFSYHARNFMRQADTGQTVKPLDNGFILSQAPMPGAPEKNGQFAIYTNEKAIVDHCWFRGGWFDPLTMVWNTIADGETRQSAPVENDAPGGSLFVPFTLKPGERKTIRLQMAWYVPDSKLRIGEDASGKSDPKSCYRPWYSSRFANVQEVAAHWKEQYDTLKKQTALFTDTFYNSTLPTEVLEAVAANLTILKSPTVMRQHDGRFWCWEGSGDSWGSCHGSCTHVWNYAQAVPHLFPALERSLRHTEFNENQNAEGHQGFRANIPISPLVHNFHSAADGQLGGIMKVYRDWRISGDKQWLEELYPKVKTSMDYCIKTWDPKRKGIVEEPHHNTYDIEFWGPTSMCTTFYLGALTAFIEMGQYLGKNVAGYSTLLQQGKAYLEKELYNGEYFIQQIRWTGLQAPDPVKSQSFNTGYSPEALTVLQKEGPKYQYGNGCLSDGILGAWIAKVCGLDEPIDAAKAKSHLLAVHRYNFRKDLSKHVNPQRPTYALGTEGGLLLCSWPKGGKLSLPFVYSNEVWTGIEYQVASHLIFHGEVEKGLEIVKQCRQRYDGTVRNPFNEYECGHWYARAMSSYGLLQALTGLRYDAVDKVLHVDSKVGDFTSFLATNTGFGTVSLRQGKVTVKAVQGTIPAARAMVAGKEAPLQLV